MASSREETQPLYWPPHAASADEAARKAAGDALAPEADRPPSSRRPASIFHHPAAAGLQLLRRLESNSFSEYWLAEPPAGGEKILQRCFGLSPQRAAEGLARLRALSHPGLLPLEFLCGYGDQVLLLSETYSHTLRDTFARYWDRGLPGIPAADLLTWLRPVAETLDALHENHGVHHLALHPRRLVFRDGRPLLSEFGLVQLLWLPEKWLPPRTNPRYAAPEMFQGRYTPKSDQFGLALIYAELRTGVHPFARGAPPYDTEPDLSLLSSAERAVLGRALSVSAYARFPGCGELIRALESAQSGDSPGEEPRPGAAPAPADGLPIIRAGDGFFRALQAATLGGWELRHADGVPYLLEPGGRLDHTFVVRLARDQLPSRLSQLLARWDANHLAPEEEGLSFRLGSAPTWWPMARRHKAALDVRLDVRTACRSGRDAALVLRLCLRPAAPGSQGTKPLERTGLAFVRALHEHLGAAPDLRRHPRWECRQPLRVLSVCADLNFLQSVECAGKDVSARGIGFLAPGWFPVAEVGLHLPWLPGFADKAVRATVVRCSPGPNGLFEVGAIFE